MAFRGAANIDPNQHKGLIISNSITNGSMVATGLSLTNAQPLHVAMVDATGTQITSFGGGTQYTDGGVPPAHPTGGTLEWSDGSNWQTVSTAKPLPVSATFSGSITSSPTFAQNPGNVTPTAAYGLIDSSFRPQVSIATALPAGTNVIGHAIIDTGSTTAVTQATAASLNATVVGTGTFAVQATLAAETTKVIGTVNQGTSPWVVSLSSTTITGTVAATQSGTWNITNISGTVSLPTGAATAAKQPALGTAGTASSDVITIQGIASMTKLLVTPDSVALPANQSVNVSQINATTPLMGNGVTGTGSQRVTIASDNTAFSVNAVQSGTWNIATVTTVTTVSTVTNVATIGTSVTPGTAAANLGKAEDAASASGDTGVMTLGVRNDTLIAGQTSTTGDYGAMSVDTSGILITAGAPRALKGRQATTITASTAETTIVTSVASTFLDLYGLVLTNTSATATKVSVRDATAGGTITVFEVPAGDTRGFMLPVDSAIPQAAVTNNWTAQCGSSITSLEVSALFVKRV